MSLTGVLHDVRFAAGIVAERLSIRARRIVDGLGAAWRRVHPVSFAAARRLLKGEAAAPRPTALPPFGSTIQLDDMTIRIDPRLSEHNIHKLMAGRHTRHERDLLTGRLVSGDRLVELGGGIGTVAIHAARRLGSDHVFSYEANPDLESLIRENYALNDVAPTLTMSMLGHQSGTRTFYQAARFSRSSAHHEGEGAVAVEVPVRSFSQELERTGATVLVVDIQGGEVELLVGADLTTIRLLLVELHPDIIGVRGANRLRRYIRANGFSQVARAGQSVLYER